MLRPVLPLLLCLGACRTVETRELRPVATEVRVGQRARGWDVVFAGERVGQVVLFQDRGRIGDSVYIVRNRWNQDLGLIDGLGRAYRYLPHHRQPAWIGSGTIALGVERILGIESTCELVELDTFQNGDDAGAALAGQSARDAAGADAVLPAPASSPAAVDEGLPQSL